MSVTPHDELLLPELPPLADDGLLGAGDESTEWLQEAASEGDLDDTLFEDDFSDPLEDDEAASFLDDSEAELDLGADDALEPEDGFLDDRPANDLELDLDPGSEAVLVKDTGQEGLDEPRTPRSGGDDDVDLPALPREPADDSELDLGL